MSSKFFVKASHFAITMTSIPFYRWVEYFGFRYLDVQLIEVYYRSEPGDPEGLKDLVKCFCCILSECRDRRSWQSREVAINRNAQVVGKKAIAMAKQVRAVVSLGTFAVATTLNMIVSPLRCTKVHVILATSHELPHIHAIALSP